MRGGVRLLHLCSERTFSLPPRGRTEGECVQKQIRCLFGWCNTIVAQAPSTTAWSPFLSEEGMRNLAFACALGGCTVVCVCLRTTDGRPYGSNVVRRSVANLTSMRIQGWWSLNSIGSRRRQRTQLYQRCPQTNERGRNNIIPAQSLFALKVLEGLGTFLKRFPRKTRVLQTQPMISFLSSPIKREKEGSICAFWCMVL